MKKKSLPVSSMLVFAGILILNNSCKIENNKTDYLRKVLSNLEQIRSATYHSIMSFTPPADTTRFLTYYWYKKEYVNPSDTTIGSSFAWFYPDDTSRLYLYYDGSASANLDIDKKTITIDSFQTNTLPFRPVSSPFFHNARNIIKYTLETDDSISTDLKEFGDSIRFILYIPHKVIYFFGKPYTMDNPYLAREDAFTRYEIWINKSEERPYRMICRTPGATYQETCNNIEINKSKIEDFMPSIYSPPDFEVKVRGKKQTIKKDMAGKAAPEWILSDFNNISVGLKDLKSRVLMIEFTGIGCAPCHAAIPFLKQMVIDNKEKDFEFVSIETWGSDIEGLKRYHNNNELNYRFLKSTEEIMKEYQVQGVPVFYLIDKNRVIQKIITGYAKGTTDKEISDAINDML